MFFLPALCHYYYYYYYYYHCFHQVVNAAENHLTLNDFLALPSLVELRLPCNGLRDLEPSTHLHYLHSLEVKKRRTCIIYCQLGSHTTTITTTSTTTAITITGS